MRSAECHSSYFRYILFWFHAFDYQLVMRRFLSLRLVFAYCAMSYMVRCVVQWLNIKLTTTEKSQVRFAPPPPRSIISNLLCALAISVSSSSNTFYPVTANNY